MKVIMLKGPGSCGKTTALDLVFRTLGGHDSDKISLGKK